MKIQNTLKRIFSRRGWQIILCLGLLVLTVGVLIMPARPVEAEYPAALQNQESPDKVVAEAVIEPAQWSELRFVIGGRVINIPVEPGAQVSKGDLLVQLDTTDFELAVQEAEAGLSAAQAQLALKKAGPRPEELAVSEAQLEAKKAAVSQAVAQRDQLLSGALEAQIAGAEAQLAAAKAEQWQVQTELWRAQEKEDHEWEKDVLEQLNIANQKLSAAETRLAATKGQSSGQTRTARAGVWVTTAQRDVAEAQLALLKAGSTAAEIEVAEAAVQRAEAALAQAKVALDRTTIRAPFDGTVSKVYIEVGDMVSPGQALLVIATLDQLQVMTKDLTELDVVHVTEGQPVIVKVDALPERSLLGHVARIKLRSEDYRGDVTYPVLIELDENVPELLWGMTALVEIEVDGER